MLEKTLQQKILNFCKQNAIIAVKTDSTSTRGWPDLTIVLPSGNVIFVELKTETGRLSKLQQHVHEKLRGNNANIYTIRDFETFKRIITDG